MGGELRLQNERKNIRQKKNTDDISQKSDALLMDYGIT